MSASVLVCGRLPERGRAALEGAGLLVDHQPDRGNGSLADIIEPHAGVIVHSPHQVDQATIDAAANLRVVGRAGVGVDNIDIAACTDRGILVMNLPWGNTVSAAEHTVALLMAMARNIPQASAALRQGEWNRSAYLGVELDGKSLGIVGLGRIGQQVARRAHGLGMTVLGADPFLSPAHAADLGIELCSFEDMLPRCQFLTVHVPRTPETVGMINAGALRLLPEGARIVNCARGGVVDEQALLEALESGRLGGAACDVFEVEPTDNAALLAHPAFIGTPHLGAATQEARQRVGVGIARQIADYLAQGVIRNAINVAALPPDEHQAMAPYLGLGRNLGTFLSHCFEGIERLQIEYFGEITEFTLSPLTSNIVAGLMGHFLEVEVNEVNAMALARERELQIDEKKGGAWPGYSSLVRVTAASADREHVVAGTVFDRDRARLVEIDGFAVDIAPEGRMLVFVNEDAPGVVGTVGTFLAQRNVNIADMSLGRNQRGATAIATLLLDDALTPADLEDLAAHERMRWVRQVVF